MQHIVPNMGPCDVASCARTAHWITEAGTLLCTCCARLHDEWQEREDEIKEEQSDDEQLRTGRQSEDS